MLYVACDVCGCRHEVADKRLGQQLRCTACAVPFAVNDDNFYDPDVNDTLEDDASEGGSFTDHGRTLIAACIPVFSGVCQLIVVCWMVSLFWKDPRTGAAMRTAGQFDRTGGALAGAPSSSSSSPAPWHLPSPNPPSQFGGPTSLPPAPNHPAEQPVPNVAAEPPFPNAPTAPPSYAEPVVAADTGSPFIPKNIESPFVPKTPASPFAKQPSGDPGSTIPPGRSPILQPPEHIRTPPGQRRPGATSSPSSNPPTNIGAPPTQAGQRRPRATPSPNSNQPVNYNGPGSIPSSGRKLQSLAELQLGQIIQVKWGASWWPADVLAVDPARGTVRIHYRGWSKNDDEEVDRSRVQLAHEGTTPNGR